MGPRGIHPRILKELDDISAKPVLMIFVWSWESGEMPTDFKRSNSFQEEQEGRPQKLQACQSLFSAW